jgi:hypothetical protein
VKGGLQFLEQVASIFHGRLEGVKGDEVTQEQEKADTELSVVLAQIDSGLHSWWFRHVELLCHTGQEGEQLHLQHPQQESHALPLTEHVQGFEYFHGCGEGGEQGGGVEGWPGGEESSQFREETGRWLEDRKRAWGRGDTEISKKLFVTGSESQNVSQVKSFISHSFHSCKSNLERSVPMLSSSILLYVCQEFIISDKSRGVGHVGEETAVTPRSCSSRPNLAGPAAGGVGEHGGGALLPRLVAHGLHQLFGPA